MKSLNISTLFVLIVCVFISSKAEQSLFIFDQDLHPKQAVKKIISELSIGPAQSAEELFDTARKLIRQQGKERWQVEEINLPTEAKATILDNLEVVGMVKERRPAAQEYEYAIVLGGIASSVYKRFSYLAKLWREGVRFKSIVILTGDRDLDPVIESPEELHAICKHAIKDTITRLTNETGMMVFILQEMDIPQEMRNIPCTVIDTPKQPDGNGGLRRPNTLDTVAAWLATNPHPGTYFAVSNQPVVLYQELVLLRALPEGFKGMAVGPEAPGNAKLCIYLDSLARTIHNEYWYRTHAPLA